MNVSRMNHAMLSFALIGGMLVGGRQTPKPPVSRAVEGFEEVGERADGVFPSAPARPRR